MLFKNSESSTVGSRLSHCEPIDTQMLELYELSLFSNRSLSLRCATLLQFLWRVMLILDAVAACLLIIITISSFCLWFFLFHTVYALLILKWFQDFYDRSLHVSWIVLLQIECIFFGFGICVRLAMSILIVSVVNVYISFLLLDLEKTELLPLFYFIH